jgi:hypothetical protein
MINEEPEPIEWLEVDFTPDIKFEMDACDCEFCEFVEEKYNNTKDKKVNMNKFTIDMWDIIDHCGNVLISKQEDYGPSNIADAPGGPLNGLRVRMYDKIARINNLIDTGANPKNESLYDSFLDLANYSIIAMMVLDGVWPTLEDN